MPCSSSRMSEAFLQFSGSPTNTGTIWVSLDITGSPAAVRIALTRAARSWCRSRSQLEVLRCRIAAVAAERLGQRALEDVDAMHDAVAFGDAAAARAVHADRMNLVDIGHGAVALGEIADPGQRRDIAVHRIQAFA